MFDARSLLESMMGGGRQAAQPQQGGGGLADILGQLQKQLGQGGQGGGAQGGSQGGGLGDILGQLQKQLGQGNPGQQQSAPQSAPAGDGGLGDLMRNMFPGGGQQPPANTQDPRGGYGRDDRDAGYGRDDRDDRGGYGRDARDAGRDARDAEFDDRPVAGGQRGAGQSGGLEDILGQLQKQLGGGQGGGAQPEQGSGGLMDILGKVLGQATQGAREGAGRIGDATGASDALGRMTGGRSADDLLGQLKDLVANNKLGAGAALGGLGAVVLGTQTGRSVAASAARIGALALIGGLAYKALQNYQAGRPLISGASAEPVQPAPQGTGFEQEAVTNDMAMVYLQAMIAAAASDGRLDEAEQARILSGLKQAGAEEGAEEFVAEEFNNPADPEALAEAVETEEQAVQLYTAARLAIDPDTDAEKQFLAKLAASLELDPKLIAHVDASARSIA